MVDMMMPATKADVNAVLQAVAGARGDLATIGENVLDVRACVEDTNGRLTNKKKGELRDRRITKIMMEQMPPTPWGWTATSLYELEGENGDALRKLFSDCSEVVSRVSDALRLRARRAMLTVEHHLVAGAKIAHYKLARAEEGAGGASSASRALRARSAATQRTL